MMEILRGAIALVVIYIMKTSLKPKTMSSESLSHFCMHQVVQKYIILTAQNNVLHDLFKNIQLYRILVHMFYKVYVESEPWHNGKTALL